MTGSRCSRNGLSSRIVRVDVVAAARECVAEAQQRLLSVRPRARGERRQHVLQLRRGRARVAQRHRAPSSKVRRPRPGTSSTYLSPSAERGRTATRVSTDSGWIRLSSLSSSTGDRALAPVDRAAHHGDVVDHADPEAARSHLVAGHELRAVWYLGVELVGGHERQALVRAVGDEDRDDRDQHGHCPDQDGAGGQLSAGFPHGREQVVDEGGGRGVVLRGRGLRRGRHPWEPPPERRRRPQRPIPRSDRGWSRRAAWARGTGCSSRCPTRTGCCSS